MHMADALVTPVVAGTMYVASTAAAGVSIHKVRLEDNQKKIPLMGVMGAFVFAAQMINFTIPGTGSSGHLCGGMMLSALLGPWAGFLSMIGVLLIQCLFFADGGLLALGCNVWNMAFYGCFVGALLIWRPMMKNGASRLKIILASIIGCVLTLQLGAFSVVLETQLSGITELPFGVFFAAMQPIHLAIGLVEGLITAAVLLFVYEARPELLWGVNETKQSRMSLGATLGVLGGIALVVGGGLSLLASSLPDGLEWAIGKVAGVEELEVAEKAIYAASEKVQGTLSFLPDYAFKGSESAWGTTVSGIVGAVIVLLVLVGAALLFRFFRHRQKKA
ncbi:MAG: energy-coupling factor ABC transporter permease [Lachnospiraceae bacterium]|nr:energy-coupling factor ABC transporter permease [Lachnospiraceae bacterium]